jgi:hypothetical protein
MRLPQIIKHGMIHPVVRTDILEYLCNGFVPFETFEGINVWHAFHKYLHIVGTQKPDYTDKQNAWQ